MYRHCLTLVEIVHVSAGECGWPVLPLGSRTNPLLTFQQGFLSLGRERKLSSARGWSHLLLVRKQVCAELLRVCLASSLLCGASLTRQQRRKGCLQGKVPAWGPGSSPAFPTGLALVRCRQLFWAASWRCYPCSVR